MRVSAFIICLCVFFFFFFLIAFLALLITKEEKKKKNENTNCNGSKMKLKKALLSIIIFQITFLANNAGDRSGDFFFLIAGADTRGCDASPEV